MRLIKDNVERVADGAQADKLKVLGFKEIGNSAAEAIGPEDKSLDKMSSNQLKALAKERALKERILLQRRNYWLFLRM